MTDKSSKIRKFLPAIPESRRIALGFLLSFILIVFVFSHCAPSESITIWDRTIGPATLAGIDIQKRTSHFSMLMFLWIPLFAFAISFIYSKNSVHAEHSSRIKFLQLNLPVQAFVFFLSITFSALYLTIPLPPLNLAATSLALHIIFFVAIALVAFFATWKTNIFNTTVSPLFQESSAIFPILLFIDFAAYTSEYLIPFLSTKSDLYRQAASSSIQELSLSCVMLALGSFLINNFLDIHKKCPLKSPAEYLCIFMCTSMSIQCFTGIDFGFTSLITFAFFTIATLYFIRRPIATQIEWFKDLSKGLVWVPAIVTICFEAFFILAERELILPHPWLIILAIGVIFILLQKNLPASIYAGTLVSLCSIAFLGHTYQQIWDFKDYAYLYEMGNKTVALGTMLHGHFPIVDYFSAHALFDVWTQILHAFVSPGIEGILADPYGGLNELFALLILYFILRNFISPAAAILFVALFPFNVLGIKAYNICFVAILMHILLQKDFTAIKAFLFWFLIAMNAFFLYDDGVSLGIASIAATCLMFICNRDKLGLAKFIGIGCTVGALLATGAFILCTIRGIGPIGRLTEWMDLTLKSSAIWATAGMGNPHSPAFIFAYFVAPATASFALYYTTYKCFRNKSFSIIAGATILFAIAELLFIPRGIIFHNLTEGNGIAGRLLNFWPWTISCFAAFLLEERNCLQSVKNWCWIFVFGASLYASAGIVTRYLPNANNQLASTSINSAQEFHPSESQHLKGPRIVYSERTNDFIGNFKAALDTILMPSETFLDFSNSTALYAMAGRRSPSYVAQSPGLLSSLFSQKQFIEQIKKESAPIAVIGNAALPYLREMTWEPHNIPHNIRYYAVAEYIYENYKPYKIVGDYALWCKIDHCKEFLPYDYDANLKDAHHYSLNMLPYIWAHHDFFNASKNSEIAATGSAHSKHSAYLQLSIANTANQNAPAQVSLTAPATSHSVAFDFTAVPGETQYLIRVSADSYWYGYNLSEVQLAGKGITLQKFKFLGGD